MTIYRMLPNRYADAVGPFVFLDHIGPTKHAANEAIQKNGNGAHPHRGIATLTYLLNGEEEHFDSQGNYGKINSGGIQWMKAGNGIVHDGNFNVDPNTNDRLTHGFQNSKLLETVYLSHSFGRRKRIFPCNRKWIGIRCRASFAKRGDQRH